LPTAAHAAVDAVPGELIVKYRDRGTLIKHVPLKTNLRRAARAAARDQDVVWAQPNYYQHGAALPNDELYGRQWSLPAIGAPAAWDHTTGSDAVKVAIVDSGINAAGPDLAPNVRMDLGWDFVSNDADASDNVGHGTHVAGIVAARGNNGIGISGVAWRASLIPVRVLDNMNIGTCSQIADGIAYAVQQGARIVNLSLGSPTPCQPERSRNGCHINGSRPMNTTVATSGSLAVTPRRAPTSRATGTARTRMRTATVLTRLTSC
jgi:subtilisin family serine protease